MEGHVKVVPGDIMGLAGRCGWGWGGGVVSRNAIGHREHNPRGGGGAASGPLAGRRAEFRGGSNGRRQ